MVQNDFLDEAVALLRRLIATPSVSRDEAGAADIIEETLRGYGFNAVREGNNVWSVAPGYDAGRPTLLLNAHVDTVKPVSSWTRDPFSPDIDGDRLYGLGSNDCGGGLVALMQAFRYRPITWYIWPLRRKRSQAATASAAHCPCCRR